MEMPKRPIQHQLEDLSITEFRRLLPEEWVYREKEKDYGIDGEVEIFENGYATGLIFYVQLKATESRDIKTQRKVQLKKETFNYYRTLTLPTLIVRYIKELNSIYIKWSFSINRFNQIKNNKTLSFNMDEKDLWDNNTPNKLVKYLKRFMFLIQTSDLLPITTYLNFDFDNIDNIHSHILKSNIREYLKDKDTVIKLTYHKENSFLTINIIDDILSTEICGIVEGCYFPSISKYETTYDELISNMFLSLTIALLHLDKTFNALKVFEILVKEKLTSINNPDSLLLIINAYAFQGQDKKVIDLWESIPYELKTNEVYAKYQTIISLATKETNSKDMYEHYTLDRIEEFKETDDIKQLGVAYYNYARFLRKNFTRKSFFKSFSYYNKALKNNSHYFKEYYIFNEMAGLLFDLGKYMMSSICYEKSLSLKEDTNTLILYADALMLQGKYKEARKNFLNYFDKEDNIDAEWYLKEAVLNIIIHNYEVKEQKRNYKKAMNNKILISGDLKNVSTLDYEYIIKNFDALNPLCHYNLAMRLTSEKKYKEACIGFLIAALINRTDTEAWINCLTTAINAREYNLTPIIITCAYNICEEKFLDVLYPFFEENSQDLNSEAFKGVIDLIEEIIERENKKQVNEVLPSFKIFTGEKFQKINLNEAIKKK